MTGDEAAVRVIETLESLSISYMVVGSLSSNYWGVPRATQDADIVIQTDAALRSRLLQSMRTFLSLDPQIRFETVTATTRYIFEVPETEFKIELFLLSDDAHDCERFQRRRSATVLGRRVLVPSPEDVIITKLRWARGGRRAKDRDDVENVIAVQFRDLDWPYIEQWCDRHGTRELLDEIRQSLPPL